MKTSEALCKRPNEIGNFIKQNVDAAKIIVGACSKYREVFEDIAFKADLKPFHLKTVSLLERCSIVHSTEKATEKIKLILYAALYRERNFRGVSDENLKLAMMRLDRKMNRRTFLTFPMKFRQKIIPSIYTDRCVVWRGCNLCVKACPTQALRKEKENVQVDAFQCESCGICATKCPKEAIFFPLNTFKLITDELKALLSVETRFSTSRIILFACKGGVSYLDELAHKGFSYNPSLIVMEVPCIGMVTPLLILKTFDLGAAGIALIPCYRQCYLGYDLKEMYENLRASKKLLEALKIQPERIRVLSPSKDFKEFHRQLETFVENITKLASHPLSFKKPTETKSSWQSLPQLCQEIVNKLHFDEDIRIYDPQLPLGMIEIKTEECSMCGLCARRCPTDALRLESGNREAKILFDYNLCIGCGLCSESCPPKAIKITRTLDFKKLATPALVVIKDRIVYCQKCGVAFGLEKQIEHVLSVVSPKKDHLNIISKYCPNCRLDAFIDSLGVRNFTQKLGHP
jgi:ferredoxin